MCRQLVPFDFHISNKTEFAKYVAKILIIGILRVVSNAGVYHRDEMLFDLEVRIVTHYVEPFEMIGKENLEIGVMSIAV